MKIPYRPLLAALTLLAALSGCKKTELFDAEVYHKLLWESFPVSDFDHGHDWRVWSENSVSVTCQVEGVASLSLLSKDPIREEQAEVLAEVLLPANAQTGQAWQLVGLEPKTAEQSYVAAFDADGRLLAVRKVSKGSAVATLSGEDAPAEGAPYYPPRRQRVCYLFDGSFPQPGDWDYNDLVLTIDAPATVKPSATVSEELAERQRVLHVTVRAVGTQQQIAAAIRLVGIRPEQVNSVVSDDYMGLGLQRNTDYPPTLLTGSEILLNSRENDQAVIALFDDAHLACNPTRMDNAQPYRYLYNVSHDMTDELYHDIEVPEADYVITFSSAQEARTFSLSRIDPFIIVDYNGAKWEIHDYPYRTEQTLYSYGANNEDNFNSGLSWMMSVPYRDFRHATEGQPLGASDGPNSPGAYPDWAAWARNPHAALDWYLRPNEAKVY